MPGRGKIHNGKEQPLREKGSPEIQGGTLECGKNPTQQGTSDPTLSLFNY